MGKYRKRPVVIEAMQFVDQTSVEPIVNWAGPDVRPARVMGGSDYTSFHIVTLEGTMQAGLGDWIIRGVQGEFYPCKPDIFEATYEAVGDE